MVFTSVLLSNKMFKFVTHDILVYKNVSFYRTEEIEGLIQEIKSNDEKLQTMNADVAVMKLLLGAPVEETTQDQG